MIINAYRIAVSIVTVFGLISIPLVVYQLTGNPKYSIVISVAILLIFIVPLFLRWVIRKSTFREFFIQEAPHVVCSKSSHLIEVQQEGTANWKVSRTLIFLRMPGGKDLRDLLEMDKSFPLKDAYYLSPDSEELGRQRVREQRIAIFWAPKKRIYPFEPFEHTYEWVAMTSHTDLGNYKTTMIDLNTGYHESVVKTPYPIEYVMAFKKPRWKKLKTERDIYDYAFRCKNRACPQPQIINSHSFRWEIHIPQLGAKYFCVFFREGGVDYWQRRIQETRKFSRVLALLGGRGRKP